MGRRRQRLFPTWIPRRSSPASLSLRPSHHIGADAENEIDIEFSQWNKTCHGCNADFTVYPSTENRNPKRVSAVRRTISTSPAAPSTTARMEWSPDHIVFTLMNGAQPIGTTAEVIKTETYTSDKTNIPQASLSGRHQFLVFQADSGNREQSVIIHDFQFAAGDEFVTSG